MLGELRARAARRWSIVRRRPRLHWAIAISAPAGPAGEVWGDLYFADDLAASLRRRGQVVHVDRLGERIRPYPRMRDDVVLQLVGLHRPLPVEGAVNLLWVISHPELVTDEVLVLDWDVRYAASSTWGRARSRPGAPVLPLLQATDPERFTPAPSGDEVGTDVLFVGKTRGVHRAVVRDAVEAGADLVIYGDGWGEYIDLRYVRAEFLPNDQVPAVYRGARVVLNDHWPEMAEAGFVSNRLFDAVAAGAIVVSDRVAGLPDEFGASVRVYQGVDELRALLDPDAPGWPDRAARLATAAAVAREHSFDRRADELLEAALAARAVRRGRQRRRSLRAAARARRTTA
ncbi:glycosyltransferase [Herbiconiux moechotypicola]|uniref:Spore protein YkvP/CgeB glycosyl transferase-like domain-containing protein n=1 Tax=Herbiconiux moechotypicola TaxID=637393 RepID=A0ABN3DUW0_9MICO|nr:glycosyltransferase [Herbiconiux moechotypicola]MCS5731001.1 glycosyltransferase [Herbiconiux moechotypicola]